MTQRSSRARCASVTHWRVSAMMETLAVAPSPILWLKLTEISNSLAFARRVRTRE